MSEQILGNALTVVGSIVVVVGGWYLNERSKREAARYRRKERRYQGLLAAFSRAFYVGAPAGEARSQARQRFLDELNLAWIYCPDHVIRAANVFLDTVRIGTDAAEGQRETASRAFILALRRDLLGSTELRAEEFFVGTPNP